MRVGQRNQILCFHYIMENKIKGVGFIWLGSDGQHSVHVHLWHEKDEKI